jgi:hypothetical protein
MSASEYITGFYFTPSILFFFILLSLPSVLQYNSFPLRITSFSYIFLNWKPTFFIISFICPLELSAFKVTKTLFSVRAPFLTWSLTLREEHRLRVFENRVLRRIFGPKRDEVTGGWRKLHSEDLHNLYSSPSIIRMIKSRWMRWARHVAGMREKSNAYRILVGTPEGKTPLGGARRRWVDNIKMDLR